MVEGVGQSGGNAGVQPSTHTLAPSALVLEVPLQAVRRKTPAPSPGAGFATGGEGGRGAYVHTPIGTSHGHTFKGSTLEYVQKDRNRRRFKQIMEVVASMSRCGREQQARALMGCGRYFKQSNPLPCGTVKLLPNFCDSVFCPNCAARRSKPLQEKILKRVNQSKYRYFFLTLTVRNYKDLTRESLKRLNKQFAKLRGFDVWKKEIRGGVYSVETTYNAETQEWHPHFHVLLESRRRLPNSWLGLVKEEWRRITGSHVIRLERMYGTDRRGRKYRRINRSGLKELVKYATKTASFGYSPELVDTFLIAFENVRRMQSFGSFLGVQKEAEQEAKKQADPTADKFALVGCNCGMCIWGIVTWKHELVHISQTVLFPDGSRQLKLFDSGTSPPAEKPIEREQSSDFVAPCAMEANLFAPQLRLV